MSEKLALYEYRITTADGKTVEIEAHEHKKLHGFRNVPYMQVLRDGEVIGEFQNVSSWFRQPVEAVAAVAAAF